MTRIPQNQFGGPPTQEEETSFLTPVLSAVSAVGNFLDLPGSSVRDLVMGENPFDQWMTPFAPENRTRGEEINQAIGLQDNHEDWYDFLPAVATEIALDPLLLLGGPITRTATGKEIKTAAEGADYLKAVIKGEEKAASAITPLGRQKELAAGERVLLRAGLPFGKKDIDLIKGGETAAKAFDFLTYGGSSKIGAIASSPARSMRALFSHAADSNFTGVAVKAADETAEALHQFRAAAMDVAAQLNVTVRNTMSNVSGVVAHTSVIGADETGDAFANNFLRYIGERLDDIAVEGPRLAEGPLVAALGRPINDAERAIRDDAIEIVGQMKETQDAVWLHLKELGAASEDLDDMASHFARRKVGEVGPFKATKRRAETHRNIPGGAYTENNISRNELLSGTKEIMKTADGRGEVRNGIRVWYNKRYVEAQNGEFIPQQILDNREVIERFAAEEKILSTKAMQAFMMADKEVLQPSMWQVDDVAKEMENWLPKRVMEDGKLVSYEIPKQADELLDTFSDSSQAVQELGVFGNPIFLDHMSYLDGAMSKAADIMGMQHLIKMEGVLTPYTPGSVRLSEVWDNANLSQGSLKNVFGKNWREEAEKAISPQAAKYIRTSTEAAQRPAMDEMASLWDGVTGFYKTYLTMPAVAFHTRNLLSGFWQSATDLRVNPVELAKGYKDAWKYMAGRKGGEDILGYMDEVRDLNILTGGRSFDIIAGRDIGRNLPEGALGGVTQPIGRVLSGEQRILDAINPANIRNLTKAQTDELAEAGIKVSSGRLVDKDSNLIVAVGEKLFDGVEFMNRAGYYVALRKKGIAPSKAAALVERSQFNYTKLSQFEKNVAKRVVPFWAWTRNSLPHTMVKLAESPGGPTAQALRAVNVSQEDPTSYTPSFLKEKMGIAVGEKTQEGQTYLTGLGLPFEDLNKIAFRDGVPQATRTAERLVADAHPLIKAAMESVSGKQLYTGRDLKYVKKPSEVHGMFEPDSTLAGITDPFIPHSPFSRFLSMYGKARRAYKAVESGATGQAATQAANILSGVNLATYEPEKYRAIDIASEMRRQLAERPEVREGRFQYISPDAVPDPELVEGLRRQRGLQAYAAQLREQERLGR
jgi:hypothetical protein